jgi:hypothetical protein
LLSCFHKFFLSSLLFCIIYFALSFSHSSIYLYFLFCGLEWSREKLVEAWMSDPKSACEKAGVRLPEGEFMRWINNEKIHSFLPLVTLGKMFCFFVGIVLILFFVLFFQDT